MIPVRFQQPKAHPLKYRNTRTKGFDSRHELKVYEDLLWQQKFPQDGSRRIASIERQVRYELVPDQYVGGRRTERAVHYLADFRVSFADGTVEVIDAKSPATRKLAAYVIKRKLMLRVHEVTIVER